MSDLHTVWRSELAADEQTAIASCVGAVPSGATTGGRLAADDPELRRQVVAGLEHQRSWWNRTHVYAEVAKRIDAPTRESIELVTEQIVATCVCLEPDADPRYAELDATRYSSQRILDAEHEIVTTARTRADWVIAPRPDERLGEDQALAVEALTALPHRLTTIVGPAGAGKTSMLQSVAASYRAAGREVSRADPVGGGRPGRHRGDRDPGDDDRRLAARHRRPAVCRARARRRGLDGADPHPATAHSGREGHGLSRRARRRLRPDGFARSRWTAA